MEMIEPGDAAPERKLAPLTIPACGTSAVSSENEEKRALSEVPGTVAVTTTGPLAAPSVTTVEASPCPSVVAPAGLSEASPWLTTNSTRAPAKGI